VVVVCGLTNYTCSRRNCDLFGASAGGLLLLRGFGFGWSQLQLNFEFQRRNIGFQVFFFLIARLRRCDFSR